MEKERKTVDLPVEMVREIEKFQKENYITTFTAAMIELVRRGLNASKEK